MPMKMGIHRKPIDCGHLAFLDSRLRRNDGVCSFSEPKMLYCPLRGQHSILGSGFNCDMDIRYEHLNRSGSG